MGTSRGRSEGEQWPRKRWCCWRLPCRPYGWWGRCILLPRRRRRTGPSDPSPRRRCSGRAVGGDDHPLWVWRSRSSRGDAARRVQLCTFQSVCVSGCRRRPERHLHPAGREQLSVYRDCPKRGGLLHVLRGRQGCEPSGGIGLRRFHDTGWPTPNADAHAYAHTDPYAYTDTHADPYTHPNTDAHTHADPDSHSHADPDAQSNADPDTHSNAHADAHANTNADPYAHTHTLAHTDTLGCGNGRGGKHAGTGDRPADFRGSATCNRCRGVSP